jgi:hypothetical protein
MANDFEVSFNSPQCGWMAVGFKHPGGEYNTTTAHTPHDRALADLLETLAAVVTSNESYKRTLKWNRDPEEYDFNFGSTGEQASLEIIEYPTKSRSDAEKVFEYSGDANQMAAAFVETFQQMYEERDIDEFEANWHQKFPKKEFDALKHAVQSKS